MPLTINVGLSRKASKDFQSTGTSINITAELDQSLLSRPDELQAQVDHLYRQAETALDRHTQVSPQPGVRTNGVPGNGSAKAGTQAEGQGGNGHTGNGKPPPMSEAQSRAIYAIARRLGIDPVAECMKTFNWSLDCLSIREASELIDHLKAKQEAITLGGR